MTTKKLQVQCTCAEDWAMEALSDLGSSANFHCEHVTDQEQRWGEERVSANE